MRGGDKNGATTSEGRGGTPLTPARKVREADKLYAKLPRFGRLVERTLDFIDQSLSTIPGGMFVSFSGGKDSTVLLDLVRRILPDTPAVFADSGAEFPETLEFIASTPGVKIYYPELSILEMYRMVDAYGSTGGEYGKNEYHWAGRAVLDCIIVEPMKRARQELNAIGQFIGLRSEESVARRIVACKYGRLFQVKVGDWRCYPLMAWTTQDIWSYIVSRNLAYNAVYDKLAELGVDRERARMSTYLCASVLNFGEWAVLKRGWPELFNRLAAEFPEARCFV